MTASRFVRLLGVAGAIVALWTAYAFFYASQMYRIAVDTSFTTNQDWALLVYFHLTSALLWSVLTPVVIYIAERLPLEKPLRWRNVGLLLILIPLLAVLRAAVGGAVFRIFEGPNTLADVVAFVVLSIERRFYRNVFLLVVIVGLVNLVLANRAAAASERRALKLKKELANDQLQRLRAAMQPRFLFAALQAVKTQARQPFVADRMLVTLGGVLRKILDFEQRGDVSLAEELAVVDGCLELERIRTRGLFTTQIEVDGRLLRARIPPLLLHAVADSAVLVDETGPGHLHLEAWSQDGALRILIRNDDPRRSPGTTALEATRARLQRAFGDRASVESHEHPRCVVTTLTLPLDLRDDAPHGMPGVRVRRA